jgi:Holliday junction resolvase RusA-like endonuclease
MSSSFVDTYNTFIVDFPPTEVRSSQQKKIGIVNGHATLFQPTKTKRAMQSLSNAIIKAGIKELHKRADVAVRVEITLYYSAPRASQRGGWKTTKPDADNLAKTIIDCITKCEAVWEDDSQVAELLISKKYLAEKNEKPRIALSICYL